VAPPANRDRRGVAVDAMILAAGLGTRLRPLTDTVPKALVEVGGVPMLERVARRLVAAGADRLIVNVHHHAGQVERFLAEADLGAEVAISRESERPLGTGGGLARAAPLFRGERPFLLHNVDIVSNLDLEALHAAHRAGEALATLAVSRRETSRRLLFDATGLVGWENAATGGAREVREPTGTIERWPFAGVHAVAPRIFEWMPATGAAVDEPFSIVEVYLRASAAGERLVPWDLGRATWMEVGDPGRLERARRAVEAGAVPLPGPSA